jgi:prepilin-type N-terminal cleavage/methylation domain-containing protein
MNKQSGFTLIELAIVLVIIGLLLGGVLKGQELINSAKVKNMASDFRNLQVAIYTFQDKYKAVPGDDKAASTHVAASGTTVVNGDGDGVIEGTWSSTTAADESVNFWQHIRLAGLASGSTAVDVSAGNTYLPSNAEGGQIGIQSNPNKTIAGLGGSYAACSSGILGKYARQLDSALDDGDTATGSMMAAVSVNGTAAATAAISAGSSPTLDDSTRYVVCMAF